MEPDKEFTPNLVLVRFAYFDSGTFGKFYTRDGMMLYTVERPWLNNARGISCIPTGEYTCKPRYYNRGEYDAVEVCDVKGRTYIMFHVGNFVSDSSGCILVNSGLTCAQDGMRGVSSRIAFRNFMNDYGDHQFQLSIVNYKGGEFQNSMRA